MSDEKDISVQIHNCHMFLNDLKNEEINLSEAFVSSCLIQKLSILKSL